jgi:hypothetical protein
VNANTHPGEVGLEAVKVMAVGADRGGPKTQRVLQVPEEPRHHTGERDATV